MPLAGSVAVDGRRRRGSLARRPCSPAASRSSPGPTDVAYATRDCELTVTAERRSRRGRRLRRPRGAAAHAAAAPRGRRGRARRAPRGRPRLPRGAQLRHARRARRRLDHRLRGRHTRRQLELLPAAQARRGPAWRRDRARGDLLLRGRTPTARAPARARARARIRLATSASTAPTSVPSTCSPRCARVTSSSCRTAGTGRRWLPPATTSTTSTSWPARAPERAWLICDDPAHGWVRDTWATQQVDPRLPFGGAQ